MKVLVIGNGGRECALCWKLSLSERLEKLYCSNGNGGTLMYGENVILNSHDDILQFALNQHIDLVIVGPEQPLCDGLVDKLENHGIKCFGAHQKSAQLEASKDFAKAFMQKYQLPTAKYVTVFSKEEGLKAIKTFDYPLVIKADGLCAGKGVKICENETDATHYLSQLFDEHIFGQQGNRAVIEEFLDGIEASLLCLVSGHKVIALESAKDYKRIFDGDKGDNTGGVGCYSPSELFDCELNQNIDVILKQIEHGLYEEKLQYNGILFIGFMIKDKQPKILEFNVRFGDPETQVVLPRLQNDMLDVIEKTINGSISEQDLLWDNKKAMTVILTSLGYPSHYEKDKLITGIDTVSNDIIVFHNNTKCVDNKVYSDGGRVLSVTTLGDDFDTMREKVYTAIDAIQFDGKQYRSDIAIMTKDNAI